MNLNCKLPSKYGLKNLIYCASLDLTIGGEFTANSFIAVNCDNVYIIYNENVKAYPLTDITEITIEPMIGGGIVYINKPEELIARFSQKQLMRISYIIKGIKELQIDKKRRVESFERERYCDKCGKVLRGSDTCVSCTGKFHSLKKVAQLAKPYKMRFLTIFAVMALASFFVVFLQQIQKNFINNHLITAGNVTQNDIINFGITMGGCFFMLIALHVTRQLMSVRLGSKISMDLRAQIYSKIQMLSLSYVDSNQVGGLMHRVTGDTRDIKDFMQNAFAGMFNTVLTMVGALAIMLYMDWKLTLLSVVFVPLVVFLQRITRKKLHRLFRGQRRKEDKINNRLQDTLQGMRVVKAFGKEKSESDKFTKLSFEVADIQTRNESIWIIVFPLMSFIMGIGIYLVTYFGGLNVLNGYFKLGDFAQFAAYAGLLYGPLGWLAHLPRSLMRVTTAIERISDVLEEEPRIAKDKDAVNYELKEKIEFKDVTFGYLNYLPVLKNISFTAKKGEMIGIVGASGTGKSTMINLIMRLYNVDEGEILFDNVNINKIDPAFLHTQLGVVLQETFLFTSSILNNIKFSKPNATLEEVITAAKTANAHDFITKFPDGYNTLVGEKGQTLSGGERQRIAIARALLADPKILILDEATSNLDTESEAQIQEALQKLIEGRTTFAIAHRLSTLRNATRLLVIDDHDIAEIGTHKELIAKKGLYYDLVVAQMSMNKLSGQVSGVRCQ